MPAAVTGAAAFFHASGTGASFCATTVFPQRAECAVERPGLPAPPITSAGPFSRNSSITPASGIPVPALASVTEISPAIARATSVLAARPHRQPPVGQRRRARLHRLRLNQAETSARREHRCRSAPTVEQRNAEAQHGLHACQVVGNSVARRPPRRRRSSSPPSPAGRSTRPCVPAAGRASRPSRPVRTSRSPAAVASSTGPCRSRAGMVRQVMGGQPERAQAAARSGQRHRLVAHAPCAHRAPCRAQRAIRELRADLAARRPWNSRPVFRPQRRVRDQAPRSRREQRAHRRAAGEFEEVPA